MFKVVALLAIVGYVSAGISARDAIALNQQIATQNAINAQGALRNAAVQGSFVQGVVPLTYGVQSVGTVSVRDAVALNNQIATQNAINAQGAVRNAVLQQAVVAPATTYSVAAPVATTYAVAGDVHAVNDAVYTQAAIQQGNIAQQQGNIALAQGIAAQNAGALASGNLVVPTGYTVLGHQGVSARDALALNQQIATQNAINAQGALRNAGVLVR